MSEDLLLLIVRGVAVVIALFLLWLAVILLRKSRAQEFDFEPRRSALDEDSPLPENETTEFDKKGVEIHQTKRLNPGFFGKSGSKEVQEVPAPHADIPLSIMARYGKHFTGNDIVNLVNNFGLLASPNGTFEMINEASANILFTMLNIHNPGTFPKNLQDVERIDGMMLVMQLPNEHDAVKDYETFAAIAKEMTEACDGRLCDFNRRPVGSRDLTDYRFAVEAFQNEYNQWLAARQEAL